MPPGISWRPEFRSSSLIVGWNSDTGKLGDKAIDFLVDSLGGQAFSEIEPFDYFPLGGVSIEDDLVQFPESKFYAFPMQKLVILKSSQPNFEWYRFFTQVLDISQRFCNVRDVYIIGGMASVTPHTTPRRLLGIFSSFDFKENLVPYDIDDSPDYETPIGQKPTLNSFLLWASMKRNIPGVSLWVPIPLYLMSVDDPKAQKRILEFFNERFNLGLDLRQFDEAVKTLDHYLDEIRDYFPDVDASIQRLESKLMLSEEENLKLVKQVEEYLKEKRDS